MAKIHEKITDEMASWIGQQHLFFVATAPGDLNGHVNCSPKGGDSFRIIDPMTVAYQDLTGSGIETVAHIRENGRIVIMFCAFEGPPKILRLHGRADVIDERHPDFHSLAVHFNPDIGARAIIRIHVSRIAYSC